MLKKIIQISKEVYSHMGGLNFDEKDELAFITNDSKLMSSISKSRINVLFLDEVTNVLDEQGKERLVEILLREENLNTYIVSHGWTHPLLSKIDIIKEQKISRLDG